MPRQVSPSEGKILAEKEKMLFFETSAKNASGVNIMMYSCISQLPFFDQVEVDKETLIQELSNNNNNKNTEGGIFEIDIDKNAKNNNNMEQNQTNIVLKTKNNEEKKKKSCGC